MHLSIPVTHGSTAGFTITLCTLCSTSAPCLCAAFVLLSDCLWWTHCRFCCLRSQLIPLDPSLACRSFFSKAPVCSPCSCDRQLFLILLLPYQAPSPHHLPCPVWVAILLWDFLSGKLMGFKHHVPSVVTLWFCNWNVACSAKFLKYIRTVKETPLFTLIISNAIRKIIHILHNSALFSFCLLFFQQLFGTWFAVEDGVQQKGYTNDSKQLQPLVLGVLSLMAFPMM